MGRGCCKAGNALRIDVVGGWRAHQEVSLEACCKCSLSLRLLRLVAFEEWKCLSPREMSGHNEIYEAFLYVGQILERTVRHQASSGLVQCRRHSHKRTSCWEARTSKETAGVAETSCKESLVEMPIACSCSSVPTGINTVRFDIIPQQPIGNVPNTRLRVLARTITSGPEQTNNKFRHLPFAPLCTLCGLRAANAPRLHRASSSSRDDNPAVVQTKHQCIAQRFGRESKNHSLLANTPC